GVQLGRAPGTGLPGQGAVRIPQVAANCVPGDSQCLGDFPDRLFPLQLKDGFHFPTLQQSITPPTLAGIGSVFAGGWVNSFPPFMGQFITADHSIEGVSRRRSKGITHRDPRRPSAPDLVQRAFLAERPDQLWVADMTQQHTDEGWLYLAVVVDAFSRRVIGWSMGERPVADLPIGAVRMAVWNRRPDPGVIHHSDHGSQ